MRWDEQKERDRDQHMFFFLSRLLGALADSLTLLMCDRYDNVVSDASAVSQLVVRTRIEPTDSNRRDVPLLRGVHRNCSCAFVVILFFWCFFSFLFVLSCSLVFSAVLCFLFSYLYCGQRKVNGLCLAHCHSYWMHWYCRQLSIGQTSQRADQHGQFVFRDLAISADQPAKSGACPQLQE